MNKKQQKDQYKYLMNFQNKKLLELSQALQKVENYTPETMEYIFSLLTSSIHRLQEMTIEQNRIIETLLEERCSKEP